MVLSEPFLNRLVRDNHPQRPAVVSEKIIVDAQIETTGTANADGLAIIADEERIPVLTDPADERRGAAVGHRAAAVLR